MYINILQSTAMSFQTCIDSGNHPHNQGIDVSSAPKPPVFRFLLSSKWLYTTRENMCFVFFSKFETFFYYRNFQTHVKVVRMN